MPKAIFRTSMVHGAPVLPPFQSEDGNPQLYYIDEQGVLHGGYSCICEPGEMAEVQVETSAATIAWMKTQPQYEWLEDVDE